MNGSEQNEEALKPSTKPNKRDDLKHYRDREDFAWAQEKNELQMLAWHLKYRHEEAKHRRQTALIFAGVGYGLVTVIAIIATVIVVVSWRSISKLAGDGQIPDNLWELLLLTTSTTLLLGAPAGLLLRMAGVYQKDSESRSQEMDFISNVETALRIALASKTEGIGVVASKALLQLSEQLLPKKAESQVSPQPSLEAKTVVDLAEKALDTIKELATQLKPGS